MSNFDLKDNTKVNTTDKVNYNFDNILVTDVKSPGNNNSALSASITIPDNSSITSDLFFVQNSTVFNYKASDLYFYPLLHDNITGLTDGDKGEMLAGELIIKLNSIDDSKINAYACFFLKYDESHLYTDIDKFKTLIDRASSGGNTVNLNDCISSQDFCINYNANLVKDGKPDNTKAVKVFIFSTPIPINSDTETIITENASSTAPFTVSAPTNYTILSKRISTINDDQIYIDCNLTGEGDTTVASYNVPLNSDRSNQDGEMNYMKLTINFFIFIIALLFTYTTIPLFYKITVIDRINLLFEADDEKTSRLIGTDILISIVTFLVVVSLFSYGAAKNNYKIQTAAMGISILYILSFSILQIRKTDKEHFMTTKITNPNTGNLMSKVIEDYKFDISKISKSFPIMGDWFGKILNNTAYIFAMLGLFIFIDSMLYMFGTISWTDFIALISAGSVGVIILTCIGIGMFVRIKSIFEIVKNKISKSSTSNTSNTRNNTP